jgi:hypothetical protein
MDLSTILSFLNQEGEGNEITLVLEPKKHSWDPDLYSMVDEAVYHDAVGIVYGRCGCIHDYGRRVTVKHVVREQEHLSEETVRAMVSAPSYEEAIKALRTTRHALPCGC